jgi:general secretion pathway protein I
LSRSILRSGSHSRGFTLVEALVAVTVLMILLAAIGELSASTLRGGLYVERHVADVETAQQILAALPAREQIADRTLTGEIGAYRWRMDAQPFSAGAANARAPTRWAPELVVVTVKGPGGAPLSYDMIRLVRTGAK